VIEKIACMAESRPVDFRDARMEFINHQSQITNIGGSNA
jgi:hypothetical protein